MNGKQGDHSVVGSLYAIIMAGGAGTRFWPQSRRSRPKQLLSLGGRESLLQGTLARLDGLLPLERTYVVTSNVIAAAVRDQLPQLPQANLIVEPIGRNTAPCIGLAALLVTRQDPLATLVVLPADHLIEPSETFRSAVAYAAGLVEAAPERFVTLGVKPTYPAESFGYIERGEPLSPPQPGALRAYHAVRFHEKPKLDQARAYLSTGRYDWNSGIFVWKARAVLEALAARQPELFAHLQVIADAAGTSAYAATLEREFTAIEGVSIDYAIMEHAADVVVVEAPFRWDDVGSWQALERLHGRDADGNTIIGQHVGLRTQGSIIQGDDTHLIVTLGLTDCLIVHTPDVTLVANKHDEESLRALVQQLRDRGYEGLL